MSRIKPPRLQPGDTIGVITPASRPTHPSTVTQGIQVLEALGFNVKTGDHFMNRHGFFAGTDIERLTDLHAMFEDPEVDGIICSRGGYGSARLLPDVNYDLVRANPKVFVGYSDITSLQMAFLKCANLISFWGPMVSSEMGKPANPVFNQEGLLRAISKQAPLGDIHNPPDAPPIQTIHGGTASGTLIGGTLSLLVSTLGTPYEMDTDNSILFFEDVGEEPHRVDRMLTHLLLAGKLDRVAGVVIGECVACDSSIHAPAFPYGAFSIEEIFDDILGRLGVPVFYGLCIGHGTYKSTLPIGVKASMDADRGTLRIEESGVQ